MDIELSAALSLAQIEPVSGFIAGALKALGFHKGFNQDRTVTIEVVPVVC